MRHFISYTNYLVCIRKDSIVTQPDLGYLLNRAARRLRLSLGEALADTGLRPQQAAVLIALAHSDGAPMTPSAIALSIETDAATTSGLLERLVRDGWLASAPNPDDRRSRLFFLTEKASAILPQVFEAAGGVSADALQGFTDAETKTLKSLLNRLGGGLEAARGSAENAAEKPAN